MVGLAYYPVKGCAAVAVERAEAGTTGLAHDRAFMLVDESGVFRSQRTLPAMAVLRVEVCAGGAGLVLSAPGADDVVVDMVADGERRPVSLFGKWFGEGVDQGDAAAAWFTAVLGAPSRLVRVPPGHDRDGWGEHPGKVGFADAHAVTVISEESLAGLNERIAARGARPVPMNRFRANVIVSGWAEPHTEDRVRLATIGGVGLGYATRAVRCAVPTVEQETGRKDGPEPTRTLASYRREPDHGGGVSFGMKAAVLRPGTIAVGDRVEVTEWAPGPVGPPLTRG